MSDPANTATYINHHAPWPLREADVTASGMERHIAACGYNIDLMELLADYRNARKSREQRFNAERYEAATDSRISHIGLVCALRALREVDPAKAEQVARDIWGIWFGSQGDLYLREWLTEYDLDPQQCRAPATGGSR